MIIIKERIVNSKIQLRYHVEEKKLRRNVDFILPVVFWEIRKKLIVKIYDSWNFKHKFWQLLFIWFYQRRQVKIKSTFLIIFSSDVSFLRNNHQIILMMIFLFETSNQKMQLRYHEKKLHSNDDFIFTCRHWWNQKKINCQNLYLKFQQFIDFGNSFFFNFTKDDRWK